MTNRTEDLNLSAYGGEGWSPRVASHRDELGSVWHTCGISNEWAPLKQVLLHEPGPELNDITDPNTFQMLEPLNTEVAIAQHQAVAEAYRQAGVVVHYVDPAGVPPPNQMFVADLMWMTPEGAIVARPASTVRAGEERNVARRLSELGIPILRSIRGHGTFEGADAQWLDARSVLIGRGLRTNTEGIRQVTALLHEMDVAALQIDLPYGTMHFMAILRIVDRHLAIGWQGRLAQAAVEELRSHGYKVAFLPDETEAVDRSAFNFVTLGPREILMPANCPVTQSFLEDLGVTCRTVDISEIPKAAGAIGCLTGILQRESAVL